MKTQSNIRIRKVGIYSGAIFMTVALVFGSSLANAEDNMMGTMPMAEPPAQASPMTDNSADTMTKDHEQMKDEHGQMMKDHKKMMKRNSMARTFEKQRMMQKMGKMKPKQMPMNDSGSDAMEMDPMEPEKTKKPAEPMPMDHM